MADYFFLTNNAIPMLAKLIMSVAVTVYVSVFIPKKSRTIKWFSFYLIGYSGLDLFAFLGQVWYGPFHDYHYPIQFLSVILLSYSYFTFSLTFKSESYSLRTSPVFLGASAVAIYCLLHIGFLIVTGNIGSTKYIQILLGFPVLMFLGSVVVFLGKFLRSRHKNTDSEAYGVFSLLTILAIILSLVFVFRALGVLADKTIAIIFFAGNLFIFSFLVVAFINYLAIKTTLLFKLVGLSLVLVLLVIGLQGFLVAPYQSVNDILIAQGVDIAEMSRLQILQQHKPVLQELHEQALPLTGFLLFSTVFILLFFPMAYDNSILKPMRNLLNGMRKVTEGAFETRVSIGNYDEIGYLTSYFNTMTQSLQQANVKLQTYAEGLETRVAERTQKLEELNGKLTTINDQLAEKTDALEHMNQTRSRLFMNISHELRTPITLIRGPIENILSKTQFTNAASDQLHVVLRNANRLQQLVDQILDLNRIEAGQHHIRVSKTDVAHFLSILCSSFESIMEFNSISYSYSIPSSPIWLYIDSDKFEKIVTNLITNAIKFTPENQSISVEVIETETNVTLIVSDTGIGISREKLPHIFERFESSSKENPDFRDGLGIGLTMTKEYTQLHNGTIAVESALNKGTRFELTFPKGTQAYKPEEIVEATTKSTHGRITSSQSNSLPSAAEAKKSAPSGSKVLLVEDNRDMSNFISSVLTDANYQVFASPNGQEALKKLSAVNPDIIISDIMMPVMDGFTFLKKVKENEQYRTTPTIFLSALSDLEGKLESLSIGVNDYLTKPFNTTELLYRIDNLLEFSRQRKEALIELSSLPVEPPSDSLVPTLTHIIEQRIDDENLTIDHIAPEVAMSRSSLYREIKKQTGLSAGAFVREIRLQKARQILDSGSIPSVTELCRRVGFQNPSYFNRIYHERFGKWPSDYSH